MVVLLVVLGIAVPYCALGAGLWFSRNTGQPATSRGVTYVKLVAVKASPALIRTLLKAQKTMPRLFVLDAQEKSDHAPIALAAAGGMLVVLGAGFVYLRRRRRSDDFFRF